MNPRRVLLAAVAVFSGFVGSSARAQFLQFSGNAQHDGYFPNVQGQELQTIRFSKVFDTAASSVGVLSIHYDVPKVDADNNIYIPLRDRNGSEIVYSVQKLDASGNVLWTYQSDYHLIIGGGWEGAFSFALGNNVLYAAGLYGVMHVINPADGTPIRDIVSYAIPDPPPAGLSSTVEVSGPPAIDGAGTLYYIVRSTFSGTPTIPSHVVKVTTDGTISTANFSDFTGVQARPPLNAGPAVAQDGTIYVGSLRTAFPTHDYLVALNPDLTQKCVADMDADPGHTAREIDQSTANPVVGPDGRVYYGGWNTNEQSAGYLYQFNPDCTFQGYYPFGWDSTPVIYPDPLDPNHYYLGEKKNMYTSRHFYWVWIDPNGMNEVASWELQPPMTHELCVNAGIVDANLNTYFLGEDGIFYKVPFMSSTGTGIMLGAPRDAAYTPAAIGPDGTIYALDDRSFYIVGNAL